jgi:ATP-dependent 26S proteasome regulatory subunit
VPKKIITTNHPEKLDAALIRPGRVDMKIHFSWCTRQDTIDIVEMFYESKVPAEDAKHIIADKFTAAEVYVERGGERGGRG